MKKAAILFVLLAGCSTAKKATEPGSTFIATVHYIHRANDSISTVYLKRSYMMWACDVKRLPDTVRIGHKIWMCQAPDSVKSNCKRIK